MNNIMKIARLFEEADGFHYCEADSAFLDARGRARPTKASALRAAYRAGFTHAMIGGRRRTIPGVVGLDNWDRAEHRRAMEAGR